MVYIDNIIIIIIILKVKYFLVYEL